jgi:hypothetical protein
MYVRHKSALQKLPRKFEANDLPTNSGLPDFSRTNIPKWDEIYQTAVLYTKWSKNIPNGQKI